MVVADWSELFLLLTPDEASFVEVVLYLLWISAEGKAQRFKRIKLLVSKEHVHARNQYGRVLGQVIHFTNTIKSKDKGTYYSPFFRIFAAIFMIVYEEMIEIGLKYTSELTVTDAVTAIAVGSGDMPALATPMMMALMENAAMLAVKNELPK